MEWFDVDCVGEGGACAIMQKRKKKERVRNKGRKEMCNLKGQYRAMNHYCFLNIDWQQGIIHLFQRP